MCIDQESGDRRLKTDDCLPYLEIRQLRVKILPSERGISLIELIMFIVIISIAVAGILLVMNKVTGHSADALVRKQALAIAESLLEEVQLQDFISASGVPNAVTQANRSSEYHIVSNYNGFATTGIFPVSGVAAIAGLGSYNASVVVTNAALGSITLASASAVLITVTVKDPRNDMPSTLKTNFSQYCIIISLPRPPQAIAA